MAGGGPERVRVLPLSGKSLPFGKPRSLLSLRPAGFLFGGGGPRFTGAGPGFVAAGGTTCATAGGFGRVPAVKRVAPLGGIST